MRCSSGVRLRPGTGLEPVLFTPSSFSGIGGKRKQLPAVSSVASCCRPEGSGCVAAGCPSLRFRPSSVAKLYSHGKAITILGLLLRRCLTGGMQMELLGLGRLKRRSWLSNMWGFKPATACSCLPAMRIHPQARLPASLRACCTSPLWRRCKVISVRQVGCGRD
mmetsp:Transcript_19120/g.53301  ORF Transcript_19120/g.53301 Transcript_19120/m.53301 type:complete len:164 (+) Transcript_19120:815-1306(+)